MRLEDGALDAVEIDLRIGADERSVIHLLKRDTHMRERRMRLAQALIVVAGEPKNACLVEKRLARRGEEFLPQFERMPRPACVDLVGAIAHANDTRLARGAGARVGCAVGVEEHDALLALREMPSGPGAEDSGADDRYVECVFGCHAR